MRSADNVIGIAAKAEVDPQRTFVPAAQKIERILNARNQPRLRGGLPRLRGGKSSTGHADIAKLPKGMSTRDADPGQGETALSNSAAW